MITTNAKPENTAVAYALSKAAKRELLRFTYKKTGKVKGGQVFGDDLRVYTLKVCDYGALVEQSKVVLAGLTDARLAEIAAAGHQGYDSRKKTASLVPVTLEMLITARDKMIQKLDEDNTATTSGTKQEHYEPLLVGDTAVNCCRVYIGDKKPESVGDVYISGVCIDSETLVKGAVDPNAKAPRRMAQTVANNLVGALLPHNKWVTFKVTNDFNLI